MSIGVKYMTAGSTVSQRETISKKETISQNLTQKNCLPLVGK